MSRAPASTPFGLPWPLPAIGAWGCAWGIFVLAIHCHLPAWIAVIWSLSAPAWVALQSAGWIRRSIILAGFPLSSLALGPSAQMPAWAWLTPLAALLAIYPLRAWRDAPLFPTARDALNGLADRLSVSPQARMLDAGCGLGDGLLELRRQWPAARLEGIERSVPLSLLAAMRCPFARIRYGDMWCRSWANIDLLYVFQRPESMSRVWLKARAEMSPGSWLISLEFEVPQARTVLEHQCRGHRRVRVYRVPDPSAGSMAMPADR